MEWSDSHSEIGDQVYPFNLNIHFFFHVFPRRLLTGDGIFWDICEKMTLKNHFWKLVSPCSLGLPTRCPQHLRRDGHLCSCHGSLETELFELGPSWNVVLMMSLFRLAQINNFKLIISCQWIIFLIELCCHITTRTNIIRMPTFLKCRSTIIVCIIGMNRLTISRGRKSVGYRFISYSTWIDVIETRMSLHTLTVIRSSEYIESAWSSSIKKLRRFRVTPMVSIVLKRLGAWLLSYSGQPFFSVCRFE